MIGIATTVLTALLGLCFGVVGTLGFLRRQTAAWQVPVSPAPGGAKPPYVLDLEARNRWESVDTALLHEVNREEFEHLLALALDEGVRALRSAERTFMDRMVEAERRVRVARARAIRRTAQRRRAAREPRPAHVTGFSPAPFTH